MKKILLLSAVILIFSACKKCREKNIDLSESDKEWLVYEKGENLVYKNSSGVLAVDTVISKDIRNFPMHKKSEEECDQYAEYGIIEFSGETKFISLSIDADYRTLSINMGNYSGFYLSSGDSTQNQVFINGQYYDSVYVVTIEDSSKIDDNYPWKLYFNKQKGILKFEEKSGETWERNN